MENNEELKKLMNINYNDLLTKSENDIINSMFNDVSMKDWVYESDGSMRLNVNLINESNNPDPIYQKDGDSGFDLMAFIDKPITLKSGERVLVPTGLKFEIPSGFELQVRSRSGLALKHGIMVLNSPGTVDSGYRGIVGVILYNTDKNDFIINSGDRIAQGVIAPVQTKSFIKLNRVNNITTTDRGQNGFGSTGK